MPYLFRSFVDEMCRDSAAGSGWETCSSGWANDTDRDGKPDSSDICPGSPNYDQHNANGTDDSSLHPAGVQTPLGDACDPVPFTSFVYCPWPYRALQPVTSVASGSSMGGWLIVTGKEDAIQPVFHRPNGYHHSNYVAQTAGEDFDLIPRYCACHDYVTSTDANPQPIDDTPCIENLCREGGDNSTLNVHRDTGWQILNWTIPKTATSPKTSCQLTDLDGDGKLPWNECNQYISSQPFTRVHGGTAMCTDRSESGCSAGDYDKYWTTPGRTLRFEWDWRTQDYPHDPKPDSQGNPTVIYDPSKTPWAKVRVWLRPFDPPYLMLKPTLNNSYIAPEMVGPGGLIGVLRKPLYELPEWGWNVPTQFQQDLDPWIVVPIQPETDEEILNASFDWQHGGASATRALLVSGVGSANGNLSQVRASRHVGTAGTHLDTVDFGAAQMDGMVFVFGGADASEQLSSGLWAGWPASSAEFHWEAVGAQGAMASAASGSPTSTGGASKGFSAWLSKALAAKKLKRGSVKSIAAAALLKWKAKQAAKVGTAQSTTTSASATVTSGASTAATPQRGAAVVADPTLMVITVLLGKPAVEPGAGDPVQVAFYDLAFGEWTVVDAPWPTSGPRHAVGRCVNPTEGQLLYYGGKRGTALLDGLFAKALDPGQIFDDPVHLDASSGSSPGARSGAALVYHAATRSVYLFGGKGEQGLISDLWRFRLDSGTWTQLSDGSASEAPPPMVAAGMLVSALDGSLIVVAGTSSAEDERVWRFDGMLWHRLTRWTD